MTDFTLSLGGHLDTRESRSVKQGSGARRPPRDRIMGRVTDMPAQIGPDQVVREDCKEFEESGRKFSISQIEEIGFDLFWQRKEELSQALENLARHNNLEFSALLVTDIVRGGSMLLMSREPDGWEEINYPQLEDKLYQLDEVVSRKKQLLPLIISLLESAPVPTP